MSYATVAQLSEYLGLTDDADDALLASLIQRAQAIIDTHCNRTFEASTDSTKSFDSRIIWGQWLLFEDDLCAVTTVTNGDSALVSSTQYTTEPRNATPWYAFKLRDNATDTWTATDADITIVGKWAYSLTAPTDIVHATIRLAAWLYRQRDNAAGDSDRAIVAGNATILPMRLPSDALALLERYRKLV